MDIGYLNSIIELYLKNENEKKKTCLNIQKKQEYFTFSFNMNENNPDKTTFNIPFDKLENEWQNIIRSFQNNEMVIDEKCDTRQNNTISYYVKFKNGRALSLNNFSLQDVNNIRNIIYHIECFKDEIHLDFDEKKVPYNENQLREALPSMGFSSFKILVLVAGVILLVLVICLIVFGVLMK